VLCFPADLRFRLNMNSVENIAIKSERPKRGTEGLALIVSIIALIMSGLSLWDSHKATRRDDERARPTLLPTVPHASFLPGNGAPNMSISMGARNTGELTATITKISVKPLTEGIDENGPEHSCYEDILKAVAVITPQEGPTAIILPKHAPPMVALLSLPSTCSNARKFLGVEVAFTYKDPMNNVYQQIEYMTADVAKDVVVK
jgi:hypothetical protein